METTKEKLISVEVTVEASLEKVWNYWIKPEHITHWYFAADDWEAPYAENDLWVNGKFKIRMSSKDGSSRFDFEGVYTRIVKYEIIEYTIPDGRKVKISFSYQKGETKVVESFEIENENPYELQRHGWQAILNNFKKYCESSQ